MIVKDYIYQNIKQFHIDLIPCWNTQIDRNIFVDTISDADIIITQPISTAYRDKDYLGTEFILNHAKPDAIIIIFPSLRLDFYYFDYGYYTTKDNKQLKEPSDYHYKGLIECFLNHKSPEYFIEHYINNSELQNINSLLTMADSSLEKLRQKEIDSKKYLDIRHCHIIELSNFIAHNYKKQLLFYTPNHPTHILMIKLSEIILDILNIGYEININIDPMKKNERGIIYDHVQQAVDFDIRQYKPRLSKYNLENTIDIVLKYYDVYRNIHL